MISESELIDIPIDISEIIKLIPHRYPLLLIDKVIEYKKNDSIIALKNVTMNEPYFVGHFPDNPVMPGVLIIEAMAQASALLVTKTNNMNKNDHAVYFVSIENAKFRKIVRPGDTLYIYSKIEQSRSHVWKFSTYAKVEGAIVAESNIVAMVKNRSNNE